MHITVECETKNDCNCLQVFVKNSQQFNYTDKERAKIGISKRVEEKLQQQY